MEKNNMDSFGKRLFYLWEPVLYKWGIGFVISMIFSAVLMIQYAKGNPEKLLNMAGDQEALYLFAQEVILKYSTVVEGITASITIVAMVFIMRKDRIRNGGRALLEKKTCPWYWYVVIPVMSGTLSLALNNLVLIGNLSQLSEVYQETTKAFYSSGFGIQILCLCILVPIAEELVFRGVMYQRLRTISTFLPALVYSAVVFGFLHGNIVQGIYGFLIAILLGYVYEITGSIAAPIVVHMISNLLTVIFSNFGFYAWEMSDIRIIGTITVGCAVITAVMYLLLGKDVT